MIRLAVNRIEEPQVRDNFTVLAEKLNANPIISGQWKFFEIVFPSSGTFSIKHNMGFKPKDIIQTYASTSVTYGYTTATTENISITTSTATTVRFFIGRAD